MKQPETCPRCGHWIPNDAQPGAYPGALSRVADIEICSECGQEEAFEALFHAKRRSDEMKAKQRTALRDALATAKAIAWDGCHKIYLLLDDHQVDLMRGYGYGEDSDGSELVLVDPADLPAAYRLVTDWWDASCGLRFIETVRTVDGDPNDGFESVISQFEDEEGN